MAVGETLAGMSEGGRAAGSDGGLDALARDLAAGHVSRRTALKRGLGIALGAAFAGGGGLIAPGLAEARCPKNRRCRKRCCPAHSHCNSQGKCKCDAPYSKCAGRCLDLRSDVSHCGACDNACEPGQFCAKGTCVACRTSTDCPTSDVACRHYECQAGACVLADDPDGEVCGPGETWSCVSGTCQCMFMKCGDQNICVDTNSDAGNCGACGHACTGGDTCVGGLCGTACSSQSDCSTSPHGHACVPGAGFCGCRKTGNDCPGGATCFSFNDPYVVNGVEYGLCL
jgi:hypothetical protein